MDHRLIEAMMDVVAPYIKKLEDRVAVLEAREPQKGEPGRDGKDAVLSSEVLEELAVKAAALVERPKDGVDGKDAEPVDLETLALKAAELIAVPKDGRDGLDGKDAEVDLDALAIKAAELIEKPKDGAPGKDAEPVDIDAIAIKAAALIPTPKDGEPGAAGVGVNDLLTDADGNLVVTLTSGEVKRAGRVVGRDGKDADPGPPGKDGTDGLGFDDLTAELAEDGRTVELRFVRGEQTKVFPLKFRVPLEAGIWRDGQDYEKGDGVTFGGSFWFAQKDSPQGRPDSGNKDWRLGVKKGRDGKDGSAPPPPPGPVYVPRAKSG